jgi:hypothetical protein
MLHKNNSSTETATLQRAVILFVTLIVCSLPALFVSGATSGMQDLYHEVDRLNPYLSTLDPVLLYFTMPLSVLGSIALVMSPGLILALALNQAYSPGHWILSGFAISLIMVSTTAAVAQHLLGHLVGHDFFIATILLTVPAGIFLYIRIARGAQLQWPDLKTDRAGYLLGLAGIPIIFLVLLTPKFFWESFNGDGIHAYEAARLLLHQPLPFWPQEAGIISSFPGMNTVLFTFPSSWFIRLFGPYEVSARLPLVLYLGLLHAVIVTTAMSGLKQRLGLAGHFLISLGIISFGLVMSYSATYDPYSADIALPATQDTLLLVCFLGVIAGFLREKPWWVFVFAVLTLLTSPNGALLLGGWFIGVIIAYRKRPWRMIWLYIICLIAGVGLTSLLPHVLEGLGLPVPGKEHNPGALLSKFDYLLIDDFRRFAFLLIPCGIYPVIAILNWRNADDASRALIVVTLAVFFMYYLIAFVSLHYFVAVMVLPVVVFWRQYQARSRELPLAATVVCLVAVSVSIAAALPASTAIYTAAREIGESIDVSALRGYEKMDAGVFQSSELLGNLFKKDSHHEVPDKSYGGSPLAWSYYAHRSNGRDTRKNYYLQPGTEPPTGTTLITANETASVYVKDLARWEAQQALHPVGSQGPAIYSISRDILFGRSNAHTQKRIIYFKARINKLRLMFGDQG